MLKQSGKWLSKLQLTIDCRATLLYIMRNQHSTLEERFVESFLNYKKTVPSFFNIFIYRECVSTGAAGAQTRRLLGHHLLHPLILRLLVLCAPTDFEAQSSLLQNRLHPQIQIPNACPGTDIGKYQIRGEIIQKRNVLKRGHYLRKYSMLF